jgi:hypothetical protein
MSGHVRVLATLHIVFGVLGILGGLIVLVFFGGLAGLIGFVENDASKWVAIPIMGGIGTIVFVLSLALSLPGIIAGVGLLRLAPWSRVLTIILSAIELLHVPFGTLLGAYGLWVMLSREGERLFARSSDDMRAQRA